MEALKKIWNTTYKIITSRKGQSWMFYNAILCYMAFKLHGDYQTFCLWFFAGLAAFGIGVQTDKKLDPETKSNGGSHGQVS